MNRMSDGAIWTVFGCVMIEMTWKKNQPAYREYRAVSDGWGKKPCLSFHIRDN